MASRSRSTAPAGAAAPSSAQDNPPNAIMLVPTAALANVTTRARARRPAAASSAIAQNTRTLAASTSSRLHRHRPLAQSGGLPLQIEQPPAARREPVDDPTGQPEQPQLLRGGRIHGQAIGVIGVALRRADFVGIAILPDSAFAQQPVRGDPGSRQQKRRPPGVRRQHQRRGESAHQLHQPGRR